MQSSQTGAKKALTFVASIALALGSTVGMANIAQAADAGKVYLNFEASDAIGAAANTFGGSGVAIVDAPVGGTGKVAEFTKNGEVWAGMNLILGGQVPYRLGAAGNSTITMDVYADTASPVMIKLQNGGASAVKAVALTVGWNHLSIDMSTATGWNDAVEYNVLAVFPDFSADDPSYSGTASVAPAGQKYDFDNISINGGTADNVNGAGNGAPGTIEAVSTLMTFETGDNLGAAALGAGFEGASTAIADAPAGGNGGKALQITKAGNAWSGVNLVTAPTGTKLMDATHTSVTLDYYSPETVNTPVQFQMIGSGSTISQAVQAAPGWSKLTFDFSALYNDAKNYTAAVIFPDFVNTNDVPGYTGAVAAAVTGQNYFIDNVGFNGATTPGIPVPKTAPALLVTYESGDVTGPKAAIDCGANPPGWACAFEGAVATISAAPAGGNGGNALKIVKSGQPWAGVNWIEAPANTILADSTHHNVTFNYYSPDSAKSPVEVQLIPESGATISQAVEASPGWQTLTFDMSAAVGYSAAANYVKAVIFPDFVNGGDVPSYHGATAVAVSGQAYYVDNVGFVGATTPAIPVAPAAVAPRNSKAATVSGTAKVGKSLTVAKGTWSGTPAPTFTYSWYRCTIAGKVGTAAPAASAKCSVIAKATSASYKLVAADKGKFVRALVKASNSAGNKFSLTATSTKVG